MTGSSAAGDQRPHAGKDLPTAQILRFPRAAVIPAATANRLTLRDRIELAAWEGLAHARGFSRIEIDTSATDRGSDRDLGDYISLYRAGSRWAAWCVGCARGGLHRLADGWAGDGGVVFDLGRGAGLDVGLGAGRGSRQHGARQAGGREVAGRFARHE